MTAFYDHCWNKNDAYILSTLCLADDEKTTEKTWTSQHLSSGFVEGPSQLGVYVAEFSASTVRSIKSLTIPRIYDSSYTASCRPQYHHDNIYKYLKDASNSQRVVLGQQRGTSPEEGLVAAAGALIEHDAFLPLFKRVTYLASAAHEAGDASISVGSIKYMAHFVCSQVRTHLPSLALTYEGNVQAEWHTTSGFLILEFLPDGVVRLGLLVPNKRHQGCVTQAAGSFAVDMVMDILRAYGAVDFFQ